MWCCSHIGVPLPSTPLLRLLLRCGLCPLCVLQQLTQLGTSLLLDTQLSSLDSRYEVPLPSHVTQIRPWLVSNQLKEPPRIVDGAPCVLSQRRRQVEVSSIHLSDSDFHMPDGRTCADSRGKQIEQLLRMREHPPDPRDINPCPEEC